MTYIFYIHDWTQGPDLYELYKKTLKIDEQKIFY